jgi:hypothetical protein
MTAKLMHEITIKWRNKQLKRVFKTDNYTHRLANVFAYSDVDNIKHLIPFDLIQEIEIEQLDD